MMKAKRKDKRQICTNNLYARAIYTKVNILVYTYNIVAENIFIDVKLFSFNQTDSAIGKACR